MTCLLRERFADENTPPRDPALFAAVIANNPDVVAARLDAGASPDQPLGDDQGKTPLIHAMEGGHVNCARLLLEAGADVHLIDSEYRSPLRVALHRQDAGCVRLLLEHGADPYFHAIGKRPDGARYEGAVTDLFIASEGDPAIAAMVLEASHKFELCHLLRETKASEPNDIPAITALLDRGCPVDIKDNHDRNALMYACIDKDPALVKLLLDRGADPEITMNDGGTTALLFACHGSDSSVDVVKMLLEHGANPRRVGPRGYTMMHAAATSGNEEIMKLIAMHGASTRATMSNGQSPAAYAIEYGLPAAAPVAEGVARWHEGYIAELAEDAIKLKQATKPLPRLRLAPKPR